MVIEINGGDVIEILSIEDFKAEEDYDMLVNDYPGYRHIADSSIWLKVTNDLSGGRYDLFLNYEQVNLLFREFLDHQENIREAREFEADTTWKGGIS